MKDDLQLVYQWFTHPHGKALSHVSTNGTQTMDAIRTALSTHSLEQARQIAYKLAFSKDDPLEIGEILVWSAIYALYLREEEYLYFARELFQNAVAKYSDNEPHYRAISVWLLGLIYWQLPGYQRDAIYLWEYSLRVFTYLSYSPESLNPAWYQNIRFQVLETLFHARMFSRRLPLKDVKHFRLSNTKRPQLVKEATTRTDKPKTAKKPIQVRSIPVYQYVPAGGWGVVNPEEVGQTETDHFVFNNIPHHALDLAGRGQITIQEQGQYAIVRIKGTSMNKLNIVEGDYVLIRRQENADHTDIVLVERIGVDAEATLKRLYRQGNIIELHPESDDPQNQILSVDKWDALRILGIAMVVFKPAEMDSTSSESPKSPSSGSDKDLGVLRVKLDW